MAVPANRSLPDNHCSAPLPAALRDKLSGAAPRSMLQGEHNIGNSTNAQSSRRTKRAPVAFIATASGIVGPQPSSACEREVGIMSYRVGDIVRWALGTLAGEAYFIGNLARDAEGRFVVLATAAEVGIEIEARDCNATGRSSPSHGSQYRQRYARQRPGRLRNPSDGMLLGELVGNP